MEAERNQQSADTTWQKNASSQIALDSIFAALAALWITVAYQVGSSTTCRFVEMLLSLLSFFFFAVSAEGTITAYDEKDVLKFVYYLFWYNIAVVLIGAAIGMFVYLHFDSHIVNYVSSLFGPSYRCSMNVIVFIGYCLSFFALLWNWLRDAGWIIVSSEEEFKGYLLELNDEKAPVPHRRWIMRHVFKKRLL